MKPQLGSRVPFSQSLSDAVRLFQLASQDQVLLETLDLIAEKATDCLKAGGCLFTCGNGGSASQATHFSGELVGPFYDRARPAYASIPLGFDPASLTAISNDYDYQTALARQLRALGKPGDMLWGLSTSGNSANVIKAMEAAREMDITTVLFTNHHGGQGKVLADFVLHTPECPTPRVQELHLSYGHSLCEAIEARLAIPQPDQIQRAA